MQIWLYSAGPRVVEEVVEVVEGPQCVEELEEVSILQQMMSQCLNYEQGCEIQWAWMSPGQEGVAPVWTVNLRGVSSVNRKRRGWSPSIIRNQYNVHQVHQPSTVYPV